MATTTGMQSAQVSRHLLQLLWSRVSLSLSLARGSPQRAEQPSAARFPEKRVERLERNQSIRNHPLASKKLHGGFLALTSFEPEAVAIALKEGVSVGAALSAHYIRSRLECTLSNSLALGLPALRSSRAGALLQVEETGASFEDTLKEETHAPGELVCSDAKREDVQKRRKSPWETDRQETRREESGTSETRNNAGGEEPEGRRGEGW